MKYIIIAVFVHIISTACSQIVIHGQIKNYDGKTKVYYTPTLEGISAISNSLELTPNSNGTFTIKYNNEGYGTCRLAFKQITFSFIHSSKADIRFSIDQVKINFPQAINRERRDHVYDSVKQVATNFIEGDLAELNNAYNKMIRSSAWAFSVEGCDYSNLVKDAKTPERILHITDSLAQRDFGQINPLVKKLDLESQSASNSTRELDNFLRKQSQAFYANVFLNAMTLKRAEQGRKLVQDANAPLSIYNPEWERVVESYFKSASKNIQPAANIFEYNELVLNMAYTLTDYKKYDFNPPVTTDDELVVERLLNPDLNILDSLSLVDEKVIFAYKLFNLSRFLHTQTYYSPVLSNAINEFKGKHSSSSYFKKFEPQIESLKKYLKNNAEKFDKATIIETNYLRFEDLLSTLKGKNILIDVWATWCGPCVEDFNHKSRLKPFIDSGKISVLYISIDKPVWEKKWRENIRFNQLEGYHVLANEILIEDMWKFLGGTQGAIPRYALINKNGGIYLNEAPRPSQGDLLMKDVTELLANQ